MNWWTKLGTPQKVLIGTAIGGVAYFGYRWYANKKAAAAASSSTTDTTGDTTGAAGTTTDAGTAASGSGFSQGPPGIAGPQGPQGPPGKTVTAPPKTTTSPTATGPASNPYNLNIQTLQGKQMAEIGYITGPGKWNGRGVSGGAPVYFYVPNPKGGAGKVETGLTKAQLDALPAGTQVFTPTSYYKDIAAQPTIGGGI